MTLDSPERSAVLPGARHGRQGRAYRLTDAWCQPHGDLDTVYDSLEEAIHDAIAWSQVHGGDPLLREFGVEVCTGTGDWRTVRLPQPLLCPLLCPVTA